MSAEMTGGNNIITPSTNNDDLTILCERFGMNAEDVSSYLKEGETVTGFGQGGSESLVMFIKVQESAGEIIVRKVCGEDLSSAPWNPDGEGVMTPPSSKARCQVEYLEGLPEEAKDYFPSVKNIESIPIEPCPITGNERHKLVYDLSYVPGAEVSAFIKDKQPDSIFVAKTHYEIMRCLKDNIHSQGITERTDETIESSHLTKIEDRLELSRSATPEIFSTLTSSNMIWINGQPNLNVGPLLEFFRQPQVMELLEPPYHCLVMGDTNTENVKITKPENLLEAMKANDLDFNYEDLGIMFIDPRAIGYKSTGRHTKDDYMYDNKPIHNTLGNYDNIHGEHFSLAFEKMQNGLASVDIKFDANSPYNSSYANMEKYFSYIMSAWEVDSEEFKKNDPNWLIRFAFIMGTHFTAMPPFHFKRAPDGEVKEDPEMQKRAIAIYCEGIKWLNTAHQMLVGKRQRLFGVNVPDASNIGRISSYV